MTQCSTDELKKQIILDIEHEIEAVVSITKSQDIPKTKARLNEVIPKIKARLNEVKNNVLGSWNIESIINTILDPLCEFLTRGKIAK